MRSALLSVAVLSSVAICNITSGLSQLDRYYGCGG
jgi:hypothetical protein